MGSTILSRHWLVLCYVGNSMFFALISSETEYQSEAGKMKNGKDHAPMQSSPYVVMFMLLYKQFLHLARKDARIFVRGHYLFLKANSFPREKLRENWIISCYYVIISRCSCCRKQNEMTSFTWRFCVAYLSCYRYCRPSVPYPRQQCFDLKPRWKDTVKLHH